jgi:non-lysosomal glucosylceramidase
MSDEGLQIVEAVRSRYDGRTRNPWNEYECGSYYARAMASYALLIAYSGFRYSAAEKTLFLSPRLPDRPFTCFFSTASGWGTFTLTGAQLEINLVEGQLEIDHLDFQGEERVIQKNIGIVVRAGEPERLLL